MSLVLCHEMKCAFLKYISTTTKIESLPNLDLGYPSTKSLKISVHSLVGMSDGVCTIHVAVFLIWLAYKSHISYYALNNSFQVRPVNCYCKTAKALATPKFLINPSQWNSLTTSISKNNWV